MLGTFLPHVLVPQNELRLPTVTRPTIIQHALAVSIRREVPLHSAATARRTFSELSSHRTTMYLSFGHHFACCPILYHGSFYAPARQVLLNFLNEHRLRRYSLFHAEVAFAHPSYANARMQYHRKRRGRRRGRSSHSRERKRKIRNTRKVPMSALSLSLSTAIFFPRSVIKEENREHTPMCKNQDFSQKEVRLQSDARPPIIQHAREASIRREVPLHSAAVPSRTFRPPALTQHHPFPR